MRGFQTLALLLLGTAAHARPQEQEGRILSIFSVVNFPNLECRATENEDGGARSGLMGTCLSSTECNDIDGMKRGSCASGFGVCCVKSLKACGGTVSNNNTYISNVDYPTVLPAGANNCQYTITRQGDICQLRLDFQDVVLNTDANGVTDATAGGRLVAAGGSGSEPPAVSGTLTGDHMYVEVAGQDPTITITTLAANMNQKWNIQVSQIACDSPYKAPRDCTQYLTENSGQVRSYNTRGNTAKELGGQNMMVCIRQNEGMCGVRFTAGTFSVGDATTNMAGSTGATCGALNGGNALTIPGAGIFCENRLAPTEDASANAPITVKNGPACLLHVTAAAGVVNTEGFILNYTQL